eukprot:12742532-Alexandrium_andersonii.AAC.1
MQQSAANRCKLLQKLTAPVQQGARLDVCSRALSLARPPLRRWMLHPRTPSAARCARLGCVGWRVGAQKLCEASLPVAVQ